ncbi:MAG: ABC transporter permease [Anaerotruncus sp.]|nr:ABC transporter permease [Anaerotruncus sp.]
MTGLPGEATFAVLAQGACASRRRIASSAAEAGGWVLRTQDDFLADIRAMVESKTAGSVHPLRHLPGPGHAGHLRHPGPVDLPPAPRDGHAHGPGLHPDEGHRPLHPRGHAQRRPGRARRGRLRHPAPAWMARTGWALPGNTDSYGFAIGERLFPSYSAGPRRRDDAPRPADDHGRLVPADAPDRQAQADRRAEGAHDMIRFLLKGLLRDRSRSLLPFATVVLGSMLTVVGFSWLNGAISTIVEASANFSAGHVKVMSRAYAEEADQAPNDLALEGVASLLAELRRDRPGARLDAAHQVRRAHRHPRRQGRDPGPGTGRGPGRRPALARKPGAPAPQPGQGRRPRPPARAPRRDPRQRRLRRAPRHRPGLDGDLHRRDHVRRHGRPQLHRLRHPALRHRGHGPGRRAGRHRRRPRGPGHGGRGRRGAGLLPGRALPEEGGRRPGRRLQRGSPRGGRDDGDTGAGEFAPVMVTLHEQSGLGQTLDFASAVYTLMLVLFILVMSIVLWNAGLMASLRRYGEFGIRLALGEDHGRLYRSLIAEGAIVGLLGSAVGTALGLAVSYYLQAKGLNIGAMLKNASMMITDVLRARVTTTSYLIGFVPGLAATFLGKAVSGLGDLQAADLPAGQGVRSMKKRIVLLLLALAAIGPAVLRRPGAGRRGHPAPGRREHGLGQQDHDEHDDHPRPARLAQRPVEVVDQGPDPVLHRVPRSAPREGHQDAQARGPALDLLAVVGPDHPHLRPHAPPAGHGLGPVLRGHDGGPAPRRALHGDGRRPGGLRGAAVLGPRPRFARRGDRLFPAQDLGRQRALRRPAGGALRQERQAAQDDRGRAASSGRAGATSRRASSSRTP